MFLKPYVPASVSLTLSPSLFRIDESEWTQEKDILTLESGTRTGLLNALRAMLREIPVRPAY